MSAYGVQPFVWPSHGRAWAGPNLGRNLKVGVAAAVGAAKYIHSKIGILRNINKDLATLKRFSGYVRGGRSNALVPYRGGSFDKPRPYSKPRYQRSFGGARLSSNYQRSRFYRRPYRRYKRRYRRRRFY